jgi:phosphohistidine phosphatase
MSKEILLLRHAHTESFSESGRDFDRNLTEDGLHMAAEVGKNLAAANRWLEHIYCSTANRTKQSLEALQPFFPEPAPVVHYKEELYLASADKLHGFIEALPEDQSRVMLIGHNPGLHELAQRLSEEMIPNFAPAMLLRFRSEAYSWWDALDSKMLKA